MACTGICAVVKNNRTYDCKNKSVGGISQTVKLINRCDIDIADWTVSRGTALACENTIKYNVADPADLNAVTITGIPGKRLLNFTFSSSNSEYGTYFTHVLNLFEQGLSQEGLCNINAFADGAEVIAIVKQNFKGTSGLDSFIVLGWDSGLKIGDMTFDVNANNGNTIIPLSSLDPDLEPYAPLTLLMTDYETTQAFFDSL